VGAPVTEQQQDPFRDWPNLLKQIAELIGAELALKLAYECGGIESVYIPNKPNAAHPWSAAIGEAAFAKLCKALGGERVSLPRGMYVKLQKRRIIDLAEGGASTRSIALTCHVTERYVRRVLVGLSRAPDPRQMKLF
jgi:hypothetical protein